MIILSILLWLIGVFLFSFVLWKRLKDDYTRDPVYTFTLLVLVISGFAWIIGNKLAPEFSFWFIVFTDIFIGGLIIKRLDIKVFELIDAIVPSTLYFLVFGHLGALLLNFNERKYTSGVPAGLAFVCLFVFKYFIKNYRRFSWYPSGKVGYAGIVTGCIYLTLRSIWAVVGGLTNPSPQDIIIRFSLLALELTIKTYVVNAIIGLVASLGLIYILYLRSGRKR